MDGHHADNERYTASLCRHLPGVYGLAPRGSAWGSPGRTAGSYDGGQTEVRVDDSWSAVIALW